MEELTEALGGEAIVKKDKRTEDLLWQSKRILDNQIKIHDFTYIMQFTDTVVQQEAQLEQVKRFIKKKNK